MSQPASQPAHFVAFARALALLSVAAAPLGGCCPVLPDSVACAHCACVESERSVSVPVLCETIRRDTACCPTWVPPPVIGPLAPPDLVA